MESYNERIKKERFKRIESILDFKDYNPKLGYEKNNSRNNKKR